MISEDTEYENNHACVRGYQNKQVFIMSDRFYYIFQSFIMDNDNKKRKAVEYVKALDCRKIINQD